MASSQPCSFWQQRFNSQVQMYDCSTCSKQLKPLVAGAHTKNAGRSFVSCSKDYGGCGLFCFLDDEPRAFAPKRARGDGGTNVIGPVANAPSVTDERLAELIAKVDALTALVKTLAGAFDYAPH